jgi:hypothetical protein
MLRIEELCTVILLLMLASVYSATPYAYSTTSSPNIVSSSGEIVYKYTLKASMDSNVYLEYHIPGYPEEAYSKTHVDMEIDHVIRIFSSKINETIITRCLGGWIRVSSGGSFNEETITPGSTGCRNITAEYSYYDMKTFYEDSFASMYRLSDVGKTIIAKFGKNITLNIMVSYKGVKIYRDIPIIIFVVHGNISGLSSRYGYIRGFLTGYSYHHIGLLVPVKGRIFYTIESKTLERKINFTVLLDYDIEEHNLSSSAVFGNGGVGDVEIVLGGLPNAKIKVELRKSSSTAFIRNDGSGYGYVIVVKQKFFLLIM